jgi:hypothetical protein
MIRTEAKLKGLEGKTKSSRTTQLLATAMRAAKFTDEEDEDCALQQEVSHLVSPPTKQITTTFNGGTS